MNHIVKTVVLSGALALCVMLFGCTNLSRPGDPEPEGQASSEINGTCDAFCQNDGGSFFRATSATSQSACTQQGGDWFTANEGYTGPPPGCCCKCTLASGSCL